MSLHGQNVGPAWTLLSATAEEGDTEIQVDDQVGWRVGDEIVIASTSFDHEEAEVRQVQAVNGQSITLN